MFVKDKNKGSFMVFAASLISQSGQRQRPGCFLCLMFLSLFTHSKDVQKSKKKTRFSTRFSNSSFHCF